MKKEIEDVEEKAYAPEFIAKVALKREKTVFKLATLFDVPSTMTQKRNHVLL